MTREITEKEWKNLAMCVVEEIKRLEIGAVFLEATAAVQRDLILAAVDSVIKRHDRIATRFASDKQFKKEFAMIIFELCK